MAEDEMLNGITDSRDMTLSKLWKMVKDRKVCCAAVHGVTKSRTRPRDCTTIARPQGLSKALQQQSPEQSDSGTWANSGGSEFSPRLGPLPLK